MKKWYIWAPVLAFLFILYQNRYELVQQQRIAKQSSGLSDSLSGKYLSSRFAEQRGDSELAADYLVSALKKDPDNLDLLERSFALHMMAGNMDKAITDAERYRKVKPHAFSANNMLALAEMRKGNYVGAEQLLQAVTAGETDGELKMHALLLPIIRGWVLVGQGRYPDARQLLDAIDVRAELLPFILYQRALMADVGGSPKDAARIYDTLLESTPRPSYRLSEAAASFFERIGRKERAQEVLKTFNEQHPDLPVSLLKTPPVASATEGLAEFMMETGSLLYSRSMEETALIYLNLALYLRPNLSYAQFLLASIEESRGVYDDAIRYFKMLHSDDTFYDDAQVAIARSYYKLGEQKQAKDFLKSRLRVKENDLAARMLLADFAVQEKDYDEAVDEYTKLLEVAPTTNANRWEWYFARGVAYERLDKWQKAEPDFQKALDMQPNHPEVLNYLAYSWVVRGKNLDKARDMLSTALEARPNDAPIIDSYGWVLYAMGKYDEAVEQLERANELMPADATVNDHLGDVYWKLGREREAKFQWRRALSFNPEPEDIEKIKAKLENGIQPSKD